MSGVVFGACPRCGTNVATVADLAARRAMAEARTEAEHLARYDHREGDDGVEPHDDGMYVERDLVLDLFGEAARR